MHVNCLIPLLIKDGKVICRTKSPTHFHEEPLKKYNKFKDEEVTKSYIRGLASGFGWVNAYLKINGKPELFCEPEKIALNVDNYISILENEILKKGGKINQDTYIGLEFLAALIELFPCNTE